MNKQAILIHIPFIKRITREELVAATGICDRSVRETIEELRNEGHLIHSSSSTIGYKIANTDQEVNDLLIIYKSRIRTHLNTLIALSNESDVIDWLMDDVINKTKYTG